MARLRLTKAAYLDSLHRTKMVCRQVQLRYACSVSQLWKEGVDLDVDVDTVTKRVKERSLEIQMWHEEISPRSCTEIKFGGGRRNYGRCWHATANRKLIGGVHSIDHEFVLF